MVNRFMSLVTIACPIRALWVVCAFSLDRPEVGLDLEQITASPASVNSVDVRSWDC